MRETCIFLMKRTFFLCFCVCVCVPTCLAYDKKFLGDTLTAFANRHAVVGEVVVKRVKVYDSRTEVHTNQTLASLQLTPDIVDSIRRLTKEVVGVKGRVLVYSDKHELSELITKVNIHSSSAVSSSQMRSMQNSVSADDDAVPPLTRQHARPWDAPGGLEGRHIALYGSHGLYFNQQQERWIWQRARVLTTVEDLYTTSYTMPFLVPMLENAGAVVLQPRERDRQTHEVIVDDKDAEGIDRWHVTDNEGWGRQVGRTTLYEHENPFAFGGYASTKSTEPLIYRPTLTESGDYAVYVSYKTVKGSTTQAQYDIWHSGVRTTFLVNQQMGGGTWIYLGTFHFTNEPKDNYVKVYSSHGVVTSDAVRFGGGMGNVARYPSQTMLDNIPSAVENGSYDSRKYGLETDTISAQSEALLGAVTQVSGVPRWIEGARYWMQYAGFPDSVYNYTESKNDYTDDYASRGRWANYLAGGSTVYPDGPGLNIPLDLFLAFHSDAGTTRNDSVIGTLVIYNEFDNDKQYVYPAGGSRMIARTYADYVQSQIVNDIRATYAPEWTRRQLLNSSYAEARHPKMPAVLLELLSHQNLADMRYGLDPSFRFIVSRAIYKAMLRFLHERSKTPYVVQPLPVRAFRCQLDSSQALVRLSWQARTDSLEPTAMPDAYVLYQRVHGQDWDNGTLVEDTVYALSIAYDTHYDFKVCAVNMGGRSFPSEILSACKASNEHGRALIVNAFTRVAAPESFASGDTLFAGFIPLHYGVGYMNEVNYVGEQYEFRRNQPWESDDQCGFGASYNDFRTVSPRGNTFDYTAMHAAELKKLNYSFCSTSVEALSEEMLRNITLLDIIAGKQKRTYVGIGRDTALFADSAASVTSVKGKRTVKYELFPANLRRVIEVASCQLLLSGSYIGSEMQSKDDKQWTARYLHYTFRAERATRSGSVRHLRAWQTSNDTVRQSVLQVVPDEHVLCAEAPDGISPEGKHAKVALRYDDTNICAGIVCEEAGRRSVILAFPMESLTGFAAFYQKAVLWLENTSE